MTLSKEMKDRGVGLSLFLMFAGFINFWALAFLVLTLGAPGFMKAPDGESPMPTWAVIWMTGLTLANLLSIWLVYKWRWVGVILFVISHAALFWIALQIGDTLSGALMNLCWPIILVPLVLKVAQEFRAP